MSTAPTVAASKPRRRRIFVPMFLLLMLVLFVAAACAAVVRGEWADLAEKNPTAPNEEAITQLLQKPNGNVVVRCAIVVNAPPKDVWAAVSDYARYGEFLPDMSKVEATPQKDGRVLVAGAVHSRLGGELPFEILTKHAASAEKGEFSITWSERDMNAFKLNRGSWSVTPIDKTQQQTLLVCTLQIEMKDYPNFIPRNILLIELPAVVKAMRDQSLRRK
jgi:ribosome-associated toxin RatA of RatAB toxin-antitoxin module